MVDRDVLTISQAAERWGRNRRLVQRWCREGRIPGAVRVHARLWLIPADAGPPEDGRGRPRVNPTRE
ncbi:MAG: helix-turn-helix domain-containing protein [Armatimonadia bacterium]|nr:helix-turn-helix domain-containing protein [Armatimonadia bacterium]